MKNLLFVLFISLAGALSLIGQEAKPEANPKAAGTITISEAPSTASAPKPAHKRGPVFRPTKDQIKQVQTQLKEKSLYNGESTGVYNTETRAAIKSFQKDNGLRQTGTLNRATLEKMNVELTDAQKAIPVSESSFASDKSDKQPANGEKTARTKKTIFRATTDQIKEVQMKLKTGSMYSGGETGKLDAATRDGLKKYQQANGLEPTGRLNAALLEKMGVALTEKQKTQAESNK